MRDEDEREKHQVNFMALVREVTRLLKEFGEQRKRHVDASDDEGDNDFSDEFDDNLIHK